MLKYIIRVHFALQGHCFWIPTAQYEKIVAQPLQIRGTTSHAYPVPTEFLQGPSSKCLLSIQAAFSRPDWTLIFCDHNVQITFHVMRMARVCTEADLCPNSKVWPYLWSMGHGPIPSLEPAAWEMKIERFRKTNMVKVQGKNDQQVKQEGSTSKSIYYTMKSRSAYFNGLGAQESCDLLVRNVIHPLTPTAWVCGNDLLWQWLKDGIRSHFNFTHDLVYGAAKFPHVSSESAFHMNTKEHKWFIGHAVLSCRAIIPSEVLIDQNWLDMAHTNNLFDLNATLDSDGSAGM
ncbi:fatty acid synthase alpha subunit Lsd1 [Marasmius sp. AFHP31]|nr:fatty acid synthase alpha subunit Lsd1 [Marasmius sp. AFHP31]